MRILALIRGNTGPTEMRAALDHLEVKDGEHFILASSAALDPVKPGYCVCGRPLQGTLFEAGPSGQKPADAIVAG